MFFEGREVKEKPGPQVPLGDADPDEFVMELWEDWKNAALRWSWDEEAWNVEDGDDARDRMRLERRRQLDWLEILQRG